MRYQYAMMGNVCYTGEAQMKEFMGLLWKARESGEKEKFTTELRSKL